MKNKKTDSKPDDSITIDMPEVKDIPGQENVKPPKLKEMYDSTPSSADEEGEGLLDDLNTEPGDDDGELNTDANVTEGEIADLEASDRPVTDETRDRRKLALDKDEDLEELNEEGDPLDLGEDLDIPGSELDDEEEGTGEEDEENNSYSSPD